MLYELFLGINLFEISVSSPLKSQGGLPFQGPGAKLSLGALESVIAEDKYPELLLEGLFIIEENKVQVET